MRTEMLAVILGLCVTCPAWGVTYYVRTNGKDSNSGTTVTSPFKTITKAVSVAMTGDTIYVAPGTYAETVTSVRAGSLGNPIRLVADKAGTVFGVKAGNIVVKPGTSKDGIVLQHNYIRVEGVRVNKARVGLIVQNCTGCTFDNLDLVSSQTDAVQVVNATTTFDGGLVRSSKDDGVEIGAGGVVTFNRTLIYSNKDRGVTLTAATSSATLREAQVYSNTTHGVEAPLGSLTLVNCLIRNNKQDGVHLGPGGSPAVSIWHSTIARNTGDGVETESGTLTMTNSITAFNSGVGMRRSGGTFTHTYNTIYSNSAGAFVGTVLGSGELTSDPLFTSTTVYTLKTGSPAINAGTNSLSITSKDIVSASRPQGGGWDLGAYEGAATPIYTDVSSALGFGVITSASEDDGSGMSWVDLDADGDLDCIVTGSSARVMTNSGAGASFSSTLLGSYKGQGAVLDANNDGRPDFWASSAPTGTTGRLFVNTSGTLVAGDAAGFTGTTSAEGACAIDVNEDGWMDLVMFATNGNWTGLNTKSSSTPTFAPSKPTGMNPSVGTGNGDFASTADVNDDGHLDVLYHYSNGKMFLLGADGTFSLAPATTGGGANISFSTSSSKRVGSAWGDYDNDGDVDLVATDKPNTSTGFMFENNDNGTFDDVSEEAGLEEAANGQRGCAWGDFDNDGQLDLFIATRTGGCQLYRNLGGGTLALAGLGADVNADAQDAAFVDYDNDGDLDIALTRVSGGMMLLRNSTNNTKYLRVRVLGAGRGGTNTLGIGTRVELYTATGAFVARRDIGVARGYAGTEPLWAHFGGVAADSTYTLKVYFKSGVMTQSVTPALESTTIGGNTVAQMVTVQEPPVLPDVRVVRWRESSDEE